MRVQLRITGAARAMQKRRSRQPLPLNPPLAARAAPRDRHRVLEVPERVLDSVLVRVADRRLRPLVTDTEQHAHALRSRERHIETRNRTTPPQLCLRQRILAREDAMKLDPIDDRVETERASTSTEPASCRLRPTEVVVLSTGCQRRRTARLHLGLVEVVPSLPSLELADGDHRHQAAGQHNRARESRTREARATVCSFSSLAVGSCRVGRSAFCSTLERCDARHLEVSDSI